MFVDVQLRFRRGECTRGGLKLREVRSEMKTLENVTDLLKISKMYIFTLFERVDPNSFGTSFFKLVPVGTLTKEFYTRTGKISNWSGKPYVANFPRSSTE